MRGVGLSIWVIVSGVVGLMTLSYARIEAIRWPIRARRMPGLGGFAESFGRTEVDVVVRAVYRAIVHERGPQLVVVRADDDLQGLWGIVDEDLDDLVRACIGNLPPHLKFELAGHHNLTTPRDVVEFIEANTRQTTVS